MWPQYRSTDKLANSQVGSWGHKYPDLTVFLRSKESKVRYLFAEGRGRETSFMQSTQLSLPVDLEGQTGNVQIDINDVVFSYGHRRGHRLSLPVDLYQGRAHPSVRRHLRNPQRMCSRVMDEDPFLP